VPEKWQWYRTLLSYKWPQGDGVWLIPVLFLVPSIVTGADPVTLARASIQGSVGTTVGNHHQPGWESVWIIKEEFQDFSLDAGGKSTVLVSEALNRPPPWALGSPRPSLHLAVANLLCSPLTRSHISLLFGLVAAHTTSLRPSGGAPFSATVRSRDGLNRRACYWHERGSSCNLRVPRRLMKVSCDHDAPVRHA
jgi:hypothetical protein